MPEIYDDARRLIGLLRSMIEFWPPMKAAQKALFNARLDALLELVDKMQDRDWP